MPRQANAVDFWRGFALVSIFVNHIPGIYYSKFTHSNVSISDSADLFVFLAGWSLRYLVESMRAQPTTSLLLRLCGRALQIYAAQIFISAVAIAMLASTAIALGDPRVLAWHNAAAVFDDPARASVGLALITHQLGYFDILPLYVVLMLMAPAIAVVDRYAPKVVLPLSFAIYCVALAFRINPPTWPVAGQWFFNPLCWQLVFVLGFVLAKEAGVGALIRRNIAGLRAIAAPLVVMGLLMVWNDWRPDPGNVPRPTLFFIVDKTYETPIRLVQFLALVTLFSGAFRFIRRAAAPVAFLSMLGRNSLPVFCVGSLLSLAGQIARFLYEGDVGLDTVVVVAGIAIMACTAWISEWRERDRAQPAAERPAAS
jgi:hypothetical protein